MFHHVKSTADCRENVLFYALLFNKQYETLICTRRAKADASIPSLQEAEGARRGGEGKEEGGEDKKTRAKVAGKGGAEEPQESEATTGRGAKEAADEDCHGRAEAAAGSAQPGVAATCC